MTEPTAPQPTATDAIEMLGQSTIQHGQLNRRIYLMKLAYEDAAQIVPALDALAVEHGYTKIFAKVPRFALETFSNNGYVQEAHVPGFYDAVEDAYFMSRYLDAARADEGEAAKTYDEVLEASKGRAGEGAPDLPDGYRMAPCDESHAEALADLYGRVFDSYPFPIDQVDYILETMRTHVLYFGVWQDETLVAASSAETDPEERNTEMTDFATDPDHRKAGLATALLAHMDEQMKAKDFHCAYTIARAGSFGMNITFARMGYAYAGRLRNNTNIGGAFESMNVWHKTLAE